MAKSSKHVDPDDDTAAFLKAVEEGVTSLDAGRTVPYDEVRHWLLSWVTEKELPKLKCR
jgi:predicted transcriptional regulator